MQDTGLKSTEFGVIKAHDIRKIPLPVIKERYISSKSSSGALVSIDRGGSGNISHHDSFLPAGALAAREEFYQLAK